MASAETLPEEPRVPPYAPVYRRCDTVMVRGEGAYLFDSKGKQYLDFATGIAVNALGHNHPHLNKALKSQADEMWLCSNLFRNEQLERFSQRLVGASFAASAFFCSSGTEAVEAAIKFIRYTHFAKETGRNRIITFKNGFHGRTMAAISAGGNAIAREGFGPLLDGFDSVEWENLEAVEAAITEQTAAIMLEPVQGEGGVNVASQAFMKGLRALCDKHGLLLYLDEIQCGMGRPGTLFAYEQYGITPDLVTLAKGMGNGFPLAAVLMSEEIALSLKPGIHGSTYGSNPLAMAVGNAVLDVLQEDGFLKNVQTMSEQLSSRLKELVLQFPTLFSEVKGLGLMIGLAMKDSEKARDFGTHLREYGLLVAPSYGGVLRVLPPLNIEQSYIDEALDKLNRASEDWMKKHA